MAVWNYNQALQQPRMRDRAYLCCTAWLSSCRPSACYSGGTRSASEALRLSGKPGIEDDIEETSNRLHLSHPGWDSRRCSQTRRPYTQTRRLRPTSSSSKVARRLHHHRWHCRHRHYRPRCLLAPPRRYTAGERSDKRYHIMHVEALTSISRFCAILTQYSRVVSSSVGGTTCESVEPLRSGGARVGVTASLTGSMGDSGTSSAYRSISSSESRSERESSLGSLERENIRQGKS